MSILKIFKTIFTLLLLVIVTIFIMNNLVDSHTKKELKQSLGVYDEYELAGMVDIAMAQKFKKYILSVRNGQKIIIHIETFGGYGLSQDKILYYIKKSKADINCYADSHAMSAGANILVRCPKFYATDNARILFHVSQMCTQNDANGQCIAFKATSPTFYPEYYYESIEQLEEIKYLFTEFEWNQLLNSQNVTIKGDVLMKRLEGKK